MFLKFRHRWLVASLFLAGSLLTSLVATNSLQAQFGWADDSYTSDKTHKTTAGPFFKYWQETGGIAVFGEPLTNRQPEMVASLGQVLDVQWFERARFELHPDGADGAAHIELTKLGSDLTSEAARVDPDFQPAPRLLDPDLPESQQRYFADTQHNLRSYFLQYWLHDGEDKALARFGKPISEERLQFDPDRGTYYVMQWFERARFEYHPENGNENTVLLGLLGKERLDPNQDFAFLWKMGRRGTFLAEPNSVFVDGNGNLYVGDRASNRVNKYDSAHKLVNYWYVQNGVQALAGRISDTTNPSKDQPILYLLSPYKNDISRLMPDGSWSVLNLNLPPDQDSQSPNQALSVDESGNLYILKQPYAADFLVWKYDAKGKFVNKYVDRRQVNDPSSLVVRQNTLYLADGAAGQYKVFDLSANREPSSVSLPKSGNGAPNALSITLDNNRNVFVGVPGTILRFNSAGQLDSSVQIGSPGKGIGQLLNPLGLTSDAKGNLYIADSANHRVTSFDNSGNNPATYQDIAANEDNSLASADGVAIVPGDNLVLVADRVNGRILKLDTTGVIQARWQVKNISRLAVGPGKEVYALSSVENKVLKYDLSGRKVGEWGSSGSDKGQFRLPSGLTVASDGSVYVSDTGNQRIQKFDKDGKWLAGWGSKGSGPAQFGGTGLNDIYSGPTSLAFEPVNQVLYVVDPAMFRIQKFDKDGKFLNSITGLSGRPSFAPLAVAAPVYSAPPSQAGGNKAVGKNDGLYVVTEDGLYKLTVADQLQGQATVTAFVPGGDNGDGNPNNIISLAADSNGNVFATDRFARLQKLLLK